MIRINVKTTRTAMFCLVTACFATAAQADITGVAGVPASVSDALLASTRAANLQQSVVANLSGIAPAMVAPVNATNTANSATTVANNVRLWDEVIPPAPAPKPTQATMTLPGQPAPVVTAASHASNSASPLTAGLQTTSLKVSTSVGRVLAGVSR